MSHLLDRAKAIRGVCRRCKPSEHVVVFLVEDQPVRVYALKEGHQAIPAIERVGTRIARLSHLSSIPQIYTAIKQGVDAMEKH